MAMNMSSVSSLKIRTRVNVPFTPLDINLRVPMDGRFIQIKHDYEVLGAPRQVVSGTGGNYNFPAVVNASFGLKTIYEDRVYDYVEVPDEWQFFFYKLWSWGSGFRLQKGKFEKNERRDNNPDANYSVYTNGSRLWVYAGMIEDAKSHTDSWSPEFGARDVVTGRNMSARNYEWLCRPTTGQIGKILRDLGSEWELETLDITKTPPNLFDVVRKPWLFGWATESTKTQLPDGRWVVADYATIDQAMKSVNPLSPRTGTPIPFIGKGGSVRIKKTSCRLLENGQAWSPYVP